MYGDTFLGVLPFFHGYGFLTNLTAIIRGNTIAVIKRFEEKFFLKTIQDFKIPTLNLAPPLIVLLTKSPLVENYDLSAVKDLVSGAAPLSKTTEETLLKRYSVFFCKHNTNKAYLPDFNKK